MALRDQPYIPLYVQDFLTDEKLNMCSAASQGVYIKLMCIFHKQEPYGGILLKQKDKQNESTCLNFASKLAKLLPFDVLTIENAICELLDEDVLSVDGDFLYQKRMVKDNEISSIRSNSGKIGGKKTQEKSKNFAKAKDEAKLKQNTEYENEYEVESVIDIEIKEEKCEQISILNFDEFWDLYDKKVGDKAKLQKKYDSIKESDREKIKEHVPLYRMATPDKKFRKDPQTYINNKSWNDEIIQSNGNSRKNHSAIPDEQEQREYAAIIHKHFGHPAQ
jgi:hypothetical protein